MKKHSIKRIVSYHPSTLPSDKKTDWKRVDSMIDNELKRNAHSDTDSFIINKEFWDSAKFILPFNREKERITMRLDSDILDWLKKQGKGYQSRINIILRTCMDSMKKNNLPHKPIH